MAESLEAEWDAVAGILQRKMRAGSYEFTSYREKLISKGAGSSPRVVSVATARDRIVLKSLAGIISEVFPTAKTPLAQTKVNDLSTALRETSFDSFVRVDVKNFYPSISHAAIGTNLSRKIRQPQLATLIKRAISTPTVSTRSARPSYSNLFGVPQGLPVSNLLAEIAMRDVDVQFSNDSRLTYFRYVDDILILCSSDDAVKLFAKVKFACSALSLKVHELGEGSKSQVGRLDAEFDYLGYRFTSEGISVRVSSVQKLESTIVQLFTTYKYEAGKGRSADWRRRCLESLLARLNLVIAGCVFENVPRGWIHYFSQMDDKTLLNRLDAFVAKLVARFELPSDTRYRSFVRAHWHVTKPNRGSREYIPNFDRFADADEKAFLLALLPGLEERDLDRLSPDELRARFRSEVRRVAQMLDRDTSQLS